MGYVLVDDKGDGSGGNDSSEIRLKSLVEPNNSFVPLEKNEQSFSGQSVFITQRR